MRTPATGFRRLALTTAVLTFLLVILGGAVKATGAGSACSAWPTCGLPVLSLPVLLEFSHRLTAALVAVLALLTLVAAWRLRQFRRPVFLGTLLAIGLLGLQIVLGGVTVVLALPASAVATHLAAALAFFATLLTLTVVSEPADGGNQRLKLTENQAWLLPFGAAVAAYITMLLGGYMTSIGATAACPDWPLCHGKLVPLLPEGPVIIHFLHRLAALATGVLAAWSIWNALRKQRHHKPIMATALLAAAFYITQVTLGAIDVRLQLPAGIGIVFLANGLLLFGALVVLAVLVYRRPPLPAIAGGADVAALPLPAAARPIWAVAWDFIRLWKPNVMILLLISGYFPMWVATGGPPPLDVTFWGMLGLALSCGGANAVNMWYDRDIDAIMRRTRNRPLPTGRLTPAQVLGWGILCGAASFIILYEKVNFAAAVSALAGYLFYVFIYTMWLKRSTPQNIVIGGAAGAFPPVVGWTAVTGHFGWAAVVMFLIIFFWTPPHFWALALYKADDYRAANIPMMPVVRGERSTKWQGLAYAVALLPITLLLYWTGAVGKIYLVTATVLGLAFIAYCAVLMRERLPEIKWARKTFKFSSYYLGLLFLAMVINTTV